MTKNNNDVCSLCNKKVKDDDNGLVCGICEIWLHSKCEGISKRKYMILEDSQLEEPSMIYTMVLQLETTVESIYKRIFTDEMTKTIESTCSALVKHYERIIMLIRMKLIS